ncbi:MAG TPA: hypothetical protein VF637_05145 [Sphingomicrobium sp.]
MQAETNAITDPTEALCFAWGCILAAGRERILTMEFTRSATRVLLLLWLGGMSAGTAFAATKLWSVHEPTGMIYAALAATLSISLFWSSYRGAAALVQAASTILFVDVIAFILFRTEVAAGQGWVNLELYQQLTREGIFIWAFILAGSLFLNNSRKPEATHQAR